MSDPTPQDILARPLSADEIRFWEAVAPDGDTVTIKQIYERLDSVLEANPDMVQLPDADGFALYSGWLHPRGVTPNEPMHDAAVALSENSGGRIGIIDNTVTGQSLGSLSELAKAAETNPDLIDDIVARYGDYIDFSDVSTRLGSPEFTTASYAAFDMPSKHFALQAHGDVVALSPSATAEGAYARVELPTVLQGMEDGRIQSLNGLGEDDLADEIAQARANNYQTYDHPSRLDTNFDAGNFPYDDVLARGNTAVSESIARAGSVEAFVTETVAGTGVVRRTPDTSPLDGPSVDGPSPDAPPQDATSGGSTRPDVDTPVTRAPSADVDAPRTQGASAFDAALDDVDSLRADAPGASAGALAARNASDLPIGERIDAIIDANSQGKIRAFTGDPDGRSVYLLDDASNSLHHIEDGVLRTSASFDDAVEARLAFGSMLHSAGKNFPEAFDGLPRVTGSLGELAEHMSSLRAPGWVREVGGAADEAGSFLGRASKILGPLGVAAAGYEVYSLEDKLMDYTQLGLVDSAAIWAYRGVLTAHAAQATVDPTLAGGEVAVQALYDEWVEQFDINPEVAEALEPGSLIEDVGKLAGWLEERATEARAGLEDYARTRLDNPDLIIEDFGRAGRLGQAVVGNAYDRGADIADDIGSYASSRWDNPGMLLDDAATVGAAIRDGGEWVWDRANDLWNRAFGDDPAPETVVLGDSPKIEVELTLGDAARQFILDRNAIREAHDGEAGVFDSDDVQRLFDAAETSGVEHVTIALGEDMSSAERARAILEGVNASYVEAERTAGNERAPANDSERANEDMELQMGF